MKKIVVILIAGVFLAWGSTVQAQNNPKKDPATKENIQAMRADNKAFFESNIVPKLLPLKAQLDQALSPDDLSKVNALRAQVRKLKESRKPDDRKDPDARASTKAEMKAILDQLKPIVANYKPVLTSLAPKVDAVYAAMKDFKTENAQNHLTEAEIATLKAKKGSTTDQSTNPKKNEQAIKMAKFILWDGSSDIR